ncbi:MAG: hypothetical protein ABIQ99_09390 [Thermoflexales bacterium]
MEHPPTSARRAKWLGVGITAALLLAACGAATPAPTAAPPKPTDAPKPAATTAPAAPAATTAPAATAVPAATAFPPAPVATAASRPNLSGELVVNTWRDISADPKHPSYTMYLLMQQWAKNHPNVKLTLQPMLGTVTDLFGYITTNLRSKTLADVVMQYFPSPAQIDVDLQYDFTADLAKPNPYSSNPTWKDDFPLKAIALDGVTTGGKTVMVGTTFVGDLGDTAVLYNMDLLNKAGVTALPKTWAEFVDAEKKLKAAGIQPFFMPTAGNEAYVFSWYVGILTDELMPDIIKACDGQADEKKDGQISQKEASWCIKTGKWNVKDPGVQALFTTFKDWSPYFHEGYLAPPAPGNLFTQGKVAFYPIVRLNMPIIEGDPNVKFNWGTFYLPSLKGGTPKRIGNAGLGSGSQYLFIPKTTVDKGRLDLALDLLQYVTSAKGNDYWCGIQSVPCFVSGTAPEKVFAGNPQQAKRYSGFIDPPASTSRASFMDINNSFAQASTVAEIKIFQDYLAGTATLEQSMVAYQKLLDTLAETAVRQHPEWKADTWK